MTQAGPLVSVIIPSYNSGAYISEAIESVLAQTYGHYEVIVVDDGSTDNTSKVLERYAHEIIYFRQANRGAAAARNLGIRCSKGDLIAFLDADDLWLPNKLTCQVQILAQHPTVSFLFSDFMIFGNTGVMTTSFFEAKGILGELATSAIPIGDLFGRLITNHFIIPSTSLVRRNAISTIGEFDETLITAEDGEFFLRLAARSRGACVPLVLTKKRDHETNVSKKMELRCLRSLKVLRKMEDLFPELVRQKMGEVRRYTSQIHFELGYLYFRSSELQRARRQFLLSLLAYPTPRAGVLWLATCLGPDGVRRLRRARHIVRAMKHGMLRAGHTGT